MPRSNLTIDRRPVAGMPFDFVSHAEVLTVVEHWRRNGHRQYIVVNNPHAVMLCHRDPAMRDATLRAGLAVPDGVGVVLAAKLLGYGRQRRCTGPAMMLELCDRGRELGYRHYFYGGADGVADQLANRLGERFPGLIVAGTYCPPFRPLTDAEDQRVIGQINDSKADILWVGLGAPKQEKWILAHHGRIAVPAMIGIGAAFDFHSGTVPWAPRWVRVCGLEWAHRLAMNPRRMWRRNLDSPVFLGKVMAQAFRQRIWGAFRAPEPPAPELGLSPAMVEALSDSAVAAGGAGDQVTR